MSLLEVGPVIFGGVAGIVTYLRQHRLLATQKTCSRCSVSMRERPREDISDKSSWWCPQCKTRKRKKCCRLFRFVVGNSSF